MKRMTSLIDNTSVRLSYWLRPKPAMNPGIFVPEAMSNIIEGRLREAGYLVN